MVYFATFILPFLVTLPIFILSKPNPTPTDPLEVRGYDNYPKCYNYETRDPHTCKCYSEYEEPKNNWYYKRAEETTIAQVDTQSKKGGEHHLEECICPDYPNTELDDGWGIGDWKRKGKDHEHPKCVCKGNHQTYNAHTRKCECIKNWCPWTPSTHDKRSGKKGGYGHHGLDCKPCGPTGSPTPPGNGGGGGGGGYGGGYKKRSPSLHEAMQMRKTDSRGVEDFMGCKDQEKACESNGNWKCVDVSSLLWSCGGCPGDGVDCGSVPGVSEVTCHQGRCLIESCRRGYKLTDKPDIDYFTNTTCVNENDSPRHWFVAQGV
ncbi:uncharacterized protein I206_107167 [Kwoniella pini CBS 10737]|uniref:Protein CPL1-like domain-containing protein n=1 Tax=Kwoniella pini CBS 10737 TaxID=1296096 RepID=A0A1B9HZ49_9TREE|nr:uncharacterized protein I206_05287 [Kwoniella pini CBS 10737]OCF48508.1 hypothetical protein I206_05287 [Kwoniella pini CBS 10737]